MPRIHKTSSYYEERARQKEAQRRREELKEWLAGKFAGDCECVFV